MESSRGMLEISLHAEYTRDFMSGHFLSLSLSLSLASCVQKMTEAKIRKIERRNLNGIIEREKHDMSMEEKLFFLLFNISLPFLPPSNSTT
jgi:hypothetical protein